MRRGGSIAVSARAGGGTCFTVRLPAVRREGRHEKKGFPVRVSRSFAAARRLCAAAGRRGENSYTIYYPAAELRDVPGEDAIVARTVQLPDADTLTQEELAQRLLERLLADTPDAGVRAPMPGGTTLLSLSVLGNWARVDFSRQYARLAGIDLTLADYCVTLTLTQLDGVNAVSITSGGRELPYRETQTLTAADPLLSMREDALRPITVSLYFLDPTSGALRAEKRALALYEGQTRVNALLEALAQGPESDALAALLPEEFTVLSARVGGGDVLPQSALRRRSRHLAAADGGVAGALALLARHRRARADRCGRRDRGAAERCERRRAADAMRKNAARPVSRAAFSYHRESSRVERQKVSSEAAALTVPSSSAACMPLRSRSRPPRRLPSAPPSPLPAT